MYLTKDIHDAINFYTSAGELKIDVFPVFRVSYNIIGLEAYVGKEARTLYTDEEGDALRDIRLIPSKMYVFQVSDMRAYNEDDVSDVGRNVSIFMHKLVGGAGMDGSYYKVVKAWSYETDGKRQSVRRVELIGGRRNYPAFVHRNEFKGIIPITISRYLVLRDDVKGDMSVIVRELEANHAGFVEKDSTTWSAAEYDKYKELDILQQVLKILANSIYGATGCGGPLYHEWIPITITSGGREMLGKLAKWMGRHHGKVVYGDTDSVMVMYYREQIKAYMALPADASDEDKRRILDESLDRSYVDRSTYQETENYCKQLATWATKDLQIEHPDHAVTCDAVSIGYLQFGKKKYAWVPAKVRKAFMAAEPWKTTADIGALLKNKYLKLKGISVVKSDQSLWAKQYIAHIIAAMLSGATPEQLDTIVEYHLDVLVDEPMERVVKFSRVNVLKAGPGNKAANRAFRTKGITIDRGSLIGWARVLLDSGEYTYGSAHTESRAQVDDEWVIRMASTEVNKAFEVYALRDRSK
jgi:DNA polymerase elongation subunit (family B)